MKQSILFLAALALAFSSYGQVPEEPDKEYNEWLKKHRAQKTLATTGIVAGSALVVTGGIMYLSEYGDGLPGGTGYNEGKARTGERLFFGGLGLAAASALFLNSLRQRDRLAGALPAQPFVVMAQAGGPRGAAPRSYPSWGVRVRL